MPDDRGCLRPLGKGGIRGPGSGRHGSPIQRKGGPLPRPAFSIAQLALERVSHLAYKVREIRADKHESEYGHDGDDRKDESIFRETLSFLAVKDQEHSASFRKRRLAFVATIGRATCQRPAGPNDPSVASG
jgi:hypothetical protein